MLDILMRIFKWKLTGVPYVRNKQRNARGLQSFPSSAVLIVLTKYISATRDSQ